jgi:predicted nucleic acid-binding protein
MSTVNTVVVDANVIVAICSNERLTNPIAEAAFDSYAQAGWQFAAPSVVIAEVLFALCVKLQTGILTQSEHELAIDSFNDLMQIVSIPGNESSLIKRAVEIRANYQCKRSSDSLYIAYAEWLSRTGIVELLTFDAGIKNQIAKSAPTVKLNLLKV